MFQKDKVYGGEGSQVRVPVSTIYYIVTKVFNYKKMLNYEF